MKSTESTAELAAALAAASAEMGHAALDGKNPHFRSKFATLKSVIDATRPPLAKHGISIVQGAAAADGTVTVTTRLLHTSGQWIEEALTLPVGGKLTPQSVGSAITYARRYSLAALCGVAAEEDDDGHHASREPAQRRQRKAAKKPAPKWADNERASFCAKLGDLGWKYDDVAAWCEANSRPRPSRMDEATRRKLLVYLADEGATAFAEWLETREAA